MRTETITRNLYTFDELTELAKEKAVNNLRDINIDYEWWKNVYYDANQVGITINSFDLDRNRHATTTICNPDETAELIIENHGPDCETFKTAKSFLDEIKPLKEKFDKAETIYNNYKYRKCLSDLMCKLEYELDDLTRDFTKSITEDYSLILQREYEYLYSNEAVIETIQANEYEFDENGNLA